MYSVAGDHPYSRGSEEARVDIFAFSRQVIEYWVICVRLTKLITDLQHRKALFLQFSVEHSSALRRFNAATNPRFIISLQGEQYRHRGPLVLVQPRGSNAGGWGMIE